MKQTILILLLTIGLLTESNLNAQITRKVLFLGNSYTGVNNLPQIVHDVAMSAGDTLIFDSNTPGGYRLVDHGADATSQSKIMVGGWNYVVLQGQSQEPITNNGSFTTGGSYLNNVITQYNPCSVTQLYMTWGRKNGDATNCGSFPVMCTYEGMDSTLRKEYLNLASTLKAEVSPVSIVWNYLRQNYPNIELYQTDESHPSLAGSYAAACCFYATLFKNDPTQITFDFGLSATDAAVIRTAAKTQVFDNLNLWDYKQPPASDFMYTISSGINEVIFNPVNHGFQETYLWDFGDGDTSSIRIPTHSYLSNGTYTVSLTTTSCDLQGLHSSTTDTVIQFCNHTPTIYTSNAWLCYSDTLWTEPADSYQWFNYGQPLPETNQYLPYNKYSGYFSVLTTINGCSEVSQGYTESPEWSGYYFDYSPVANPCIGDTVQIAVLHINGFLSGFEIIQWYKNDTLLTAMNNEDTLLVFSGGTYQCKVVNPNTNCPLDTTSALIELECDVLGIDDIDRNLMWSIFPNPATETITIKFSSASIKEQIEIYNSIGGLVKQLSSVETTEINISDLPGGMYFIRLKNNLRQPLRFIKQ